MVAATQLRMSDISRHKRMETDLQGELTPRHTVSQAVGFYLDRMRIPDNGLQWSAYSRGLKLDNKLSLDSVPDEATDWTILPEVSAGAF